MRRLIALIIILLLGIVPFVNAQEDLLEMPAIASGDVIEASFEDDVTSHLYAFYGSEGDTITIDMTQETNDLDPLLVLINSDGALLAVDDDGGSNLAASIQAVTLEDDGVYFVIATSFFFVDGSETSTNTELPYILRISGQTTPDNVEDADVISLDIDLLSIGDSVRGESSDDAPLALFYLEASTGDNVTISLEDADFITLLHVFAPDGSRIAVDASFAQLSLEDDGIYIIIATDQFFYDALEDNGYFEGGTFTLVIE
jgi:hypothetical protein